MPIPGADFGSRLGPVDEAAIVAYNSGITAYAMAAQNTGYCARFTAPSTKDVKSVRLYWASIATAGTVVLTIEPIDATTGKPAAAGTPYDVNATISFTPVAGVQTYTFATLPTTGLVAGAEYAVVLITTVAGTPVWTDSTTDIACMGLVLDSFPAASGGLYGSSMVL